MWNKVKTKRVSAVKEELEHPRAKDEVKIASATFLFPNPLRKEQRGSRVNVSSSDI